MRPGGRDATASGRPGEIGEDRGAAATERQQSPQKLCAAAFSGRRKAETNKPTNRREREDGGRALEGEKAREKVSQGAVTAARHGRKP
ncbi:hypothetical protein PVAP13_1KG525104 [Panicum virgatum]|uniref:Uncharacterized protein n=1 Tax=Panicum virgatum TaxID=38727 RepID=A0A8T0XLN0_PANVG|nr:hypothetical protein PVAP13_1KG525104 [Panicum virgatum]